MQEKDIDYAAIKDRLRHLQPKSRAETRDAHLAQLRDDLREARKRGVSVNTLSAELKAGGITISAAALSKYLARRSPAPSAKRPAKARAKGERYGQVNSGTKEPEQRESETAPK
jgi:hypothetical protein